jgi:glycosyltransferase involved in cell wall biosynthesis
LIGPRRGWTQLPMQLWRWAGPRLSWAYHSLLHRRIPAEPLKLSQIATKLESLGLEEAAFADLLRYASASGHWLHRAYANRRLALHAIRQERDPALVCAYARQALLGPLPRDLRDQLRLLLCLCADSSQPPAPSPSHSRWGDFAWAQVLAAPTEAEKAERFAAVYAWFGLEAPAFLPVGASLLDRLHVPDLAAAAGSIEGPCISVIIATYNADATIATALRSLQQQTWRNLEILVVDDASGDDTAAVVQSFAAVDSRIRLLPLDQNGGAYLARNHALAQASGTYVTLHDADDWSHPRKLEIQVAYLEAHPQTLACTSRRIRVDAALGRVRLNTRGWILGLNTSSLLLRREEFLATFQGWDVVRFGADTELIKRITAHRGRCAIANLTTGPLSLQRLSADSASSLSATGYPGYAFGCRHLYAAMAAYAHQRRLAPFPAPQITAQSAGLPVPALMLPSRQAQRHVQVVIASEFRMKGGSTRSSIEELRTQLDAGISSAVIPMYRYDLNPSLSEVEMLFDHLPAASIPVLAYGEEVSCDLLIIRYPPVLQCRHAYMPRVRARHVVVVVNQPPWSDYTARGVVRYHLPTADAHARAWLHTTPVWHPIGPLVRQALHEHHQADLGAITLAEQDWTNILDLSAWPLRDPAAALADPHGRIRIGRHSRDDYAKWPESAALIRKIYPDRPDVQIRVLGGAKAVAWVLGRPVPARWQVIPFGALDVATFLRDLDVFVYFTNSGWVESFGRVIIEAMAIGVPVILPTVYQPLFADAALYCSPAAVEETVRGLCANRQAYQDQVRRARAYVEDRFGRQAHLRRLAAYGIKS